MFFHARQTRGQGGAGDSQSMSFQQRLVFADRRFPCGASLWLARCKAEGLHYNANIGNPAALSFVQNISRTYHRRTLPHYYPPAAILFITWRLFGTLPLGVATGFQDDGIRFAEQDRLLDDATSGPAWLRDARISAVVARALERGDRD
ncbi:MAG TPA: hypothetical protein VFA04_21160 [Bryobacteraceae bacterium]|nr:hypothetical protein [Bryobacteraceae bacterium]